MTDIVLKQDRKLLPQYEKKSKMRWEWCVAAVKKKNLRSKVMKKTKKIEKVNKIQRALKARGKRAHKGGKNLRLHCCSGVRYG